MVKADQLYTFLLDHPETVDGFFKDNLKNEADADWLGSEFRVYSSLTRQTDQDSPMSRSLASNARKIDR